MAEENKRIYLASPHMGGLEEVFDANWIAPLGANVDGFEKELSEYVGIKTGAALSSGTAAIHMALKAIGIKRGDKSRLTISQNEKVSFLSYRRKV